MLVLSLKQPWAYLLCIGAKTKETRSWATAHRGPILIHASAAHFTKREQHNFKYADNYKVFRNFIPNIEALSYGAIIGMVEIAGCNATDAVVDAASDQDRLFGDYSPGRYAFDCINPVLLPTPVPAAGALNLWPVFNDRSLIVEEKHAHSVLRYHGEPIAGGNQAESLKEIRRELLRKTTDHVYWEKVLQVNKKLFNI